LPDARKKTKPLWDGLAKDLCSSGLFDMAKTGGTSHDAPFCQRAKQLVRNEHGNSPVKIRFQE